MGSLISPDAHFAVWTALLGLAAFGFWVDRTRFGQRFTGVSVMLVVAMLLANIGVIPKSAPAYDLVWTYLVPAAIPLLLLKADLRKIIPDTGPTLIAFGFGAVGTLLGTLAGFHLLDLGDSGPDLAGVFSATYIGGSMNFAAVAEALEFNEPTLLTAALAADNVVGTLYFIFLVTLPSFAVIKRLVPIGEHDNSAVSHESVSANDALDEHADDSPLRLLDISVVLTISLAVCALGFSTATLLGIPSYGVLFITAYTLALANLFSAYLQRLSGDFELGMLFMFVFFVAIGAGADVLVLIKHGPLLALFAMIILVAHLAVILLGAKLVKLDLAEVVIASVACCTGPANAAAVAASRRWRSLITPGVMCGVLGYAIANFVGVALAEWLS